MAEKVSLKTRTMGMLSAQAIRAWMGTHEYRSFFHDPTNDPRLGTAEPRIYVFWHEYILAPLYLRGHCDLVMLLSRHKDAEILSRVAHHLGFGTIRGSSNKGAAASLLQMKRRGKQSHITITPDGPRGPRRQMASGAIFLAAKSGMPIVPMGFGMSYPKRAKSWDQFAMPYPFSRVRAVIGPSIHVPDNLSRTTMEDERLRIEKLMNDLTLEAELWAEQGGNRLGDGVEKRRSRVRQAAQSAPPESLREVDEAERKIA
jgi:lysophospholipid acyltransferase (LPLAT)-like uncharacterized protein